MIDAVALAALARALDHEGDADLAAGAIGRADPILRSAARRRLRRAHADALLATQERHADGGRHALRVAYLMISGAPPADADDVAATAAVYAEARAKRGAAMPFWWPTTTIAAALVAAAIGAVSLVRGTDGPGGARPAATAEAAAGVVFRGAYERGGVPAPLPGDAVIRRALGEDVPDYLIALDRLRRSGDDAKILADVNAARARALGAGAAGALGPPATRALAALLDEARAASGPAQGGDDHLAEATGALDDALAAMGAGYFVDGDVITDETGHRMSILYTFEVQRVRVFTAGDRAVRALALRRLDHLNWTHTLLGFTRPHLRAALVLLDQLDEQVITTIGPALAPGAPASLFDPDAPAADRAEAEARAGDLIRAEIGAAKGVSAASAAALGEALGKRRAILDALEKRAGERGMALSVPAHLRMPEGFAASLAPIATKAEIAALEDAARALSSKEMEAAFTAVRDAIAASVERHEVQHRLDAARELPMPAALSDIVGPLRAGGRERRHAATARAELSAYLSEIARDPRTARVGLGQVARFLFDRRQHGIPECYAAIVILEGLADRLGVARPDPLVAAGKVDRRAASRLYLAIAAADPDRLRAAAKALWEKLFEAPLPDLHPLDP